MRHSDLPPGPWPDLTTPGWFESARALHMFTQVVGKTRLALAPSQNHWWQVPLYLTARGLYTSPIPFDDRSFEVEFDLLAARLHLHASDGRAEHFPLDAPTVADFHERYFEALHRLGIDVSIHPMAVEIRETILLDRDRTERRFDPEWGRRFLAALTRMQPLFEEFRGEFVGKSSPVHFFWGSFDLAVTRFSGRRAPLHPGGAPHCGDFVMEEAYSHEVSSAGFWPGNPETPPLFYSYAYPQPADYPEAVVRPAEAFFDAQLREFVLPYAAVREAQDADAKVRAFLHSTYAAAADLGAWPRRDLERHTFAAPPRREEHHGLSL